MTSAKTLETTRPRKLAYASDDLGRAIALLSDLTEDDVRKNDVRNWLSRVRGALDELERGKNSLQELEEVLRLLLTFPRSLSADDLDIILIHVGHRAHPDETMHKCMGMCDTIGADVISYVDQRLAEAGRLHGAKIRS